MKKFICILLFTILLVGCGKEKTALDEFKKSKAGEEVSQCVGAYGSVEWKIFKSEQVSNPDVRVIQATLKKGSDVFEIQWAYNLSTKISELMFAGKPGEKTSMFMMALNLASFCMSSGANETKDERFSLGTPDNPKFVEGTRYELVRKQLMQDGWRPYSPDGKDSSAAINESCKRNKGCMQYPEVSGCSSEIENACDFNWTKKIGGSQRLSGLIITTAPYDQLNVGAKNTSGAKINGPTFWMLQSFVLE